MTINQISLLDLPWSSLLQQFWLIEMTNFPPKTLLATIGLELTTYVARHKNESFLDSNWNGWWAMKAPRLRSVYNMGQASLGTGICRPKSASCSGIESGFQVNNQTIKFSQLEPQWRLQIDWITYFTRQLTWSWVSYGRARTIWKTVSWIQIGMADGRWRPPGCDLSNIYGAGQSGDRCLLA